MIVLIESRRTFGSGSHTCPSSALGILGAVISLGYSYFWLYLATVCNRKLGQPTNDAVLGDQETIGARAVCAFGLLILSLICEHNRQTRSKRAS